jgi:hypothetical protein
MITRVLSAFALAAALWSGWTVGWAQTNVGTTSSSSSTLPRTPWGAPDLQGVWDYRTITPLQRRPGFGEFYTDEQIAELEQRASDRLDEAPDADAQTGLVHALYLTDPGRKVEESRRTSLIIDPPDGRLPDLTEAARQARERRSQQRQRVRNEGPTDPSRPWLDRPLYERCITRGMPQAILPTLYNNNIEIVQGPGYVAIVHEMVHETRVVPLDGQGFTGVRSYMGESRGHWEGDTLVVETRNFNDAVSYRGSDENLVLTERYTRVGPDTIDFKMTLEDESAWTRPWTVEYEMRPTDGHLYEYACHEGNRGLRNILENIHDEAAQDGRARAGSGG